jgi:hypothetical protein
MRFFRQSAAVRVHVMGSGLDAARVVLVPVVTGADDGARHGTYSLYARVSSSSGEPGSIDGKSYTVAYVLVALGSAGMLAVLGLYSFVSARRQAEVARAARDERDAEPGEGDTSRTPFSEVISPRDVTQAWVLSRGTTRLRAGAARRALEEAAHYESGMSLAERGRLASAARQVGAAEEALENPTAQALPDVVQMADTQLNSVMTTLKQLFSSLGAKFSAQAGAQIAENSQVVEDMGKVYDDIMEQREKGEPYELEIEDS